MESNYKKITSIINSWKGKEVQVLQKGFMDARYFLDKINYNVVEDIFTLQSENRNMLSFNLNMLINIKEKENGIEIYLDNDTIIELTAR